MDVRVNERNAAVRVPPLTALAVFALMAGFCAALVFVVMGDFQLQVLPLIVGAAIIAGVLAMLIVPRVLYTNALTAMFIGALVALLSHLPFSIFWAFGAAMFDPPFVISDVAQLVVVILAYGYVLAGVGQIILGALAGYICYRKGVPFEEQGREANTSLTGSG